jgi:hypothetical protein
MKQLLNKTALIFIIMTTIFVTTWVGCTKNNDFTTPTTITEQKLTPQQIQQNAINATRAAYGNVSAGEVINVNQISTNVSYKNSVGQMVKLTTVPTENIVCNFNCTNTTNPANLNQVYTLSSFTRFYECEANGGSKLYTNWNVSVPYTPTATGSSATVTFTPSGGSPGTVTAYNITVRYLSADPNCAANSLYEVRYLAQWYTNNYFGVGGSITTTLNLANNCSLVGNMISTTITRGVVANTFKPCNRIDKVYINPNTGPGGTTTAIGNYVLCNPPSPFTPVDAHQIEYRKVTNAPNYEWDLQTSAITKGKDVITGFDQTFITPYGQTIYFPGMTAGSGQWLVRYRNVINSSCGIISGFPNSFWGSTLYYATEVW